MEIRNIIAPQLDAAHLGEKIICYRPRRSGAPNMQVQTIGKKVVAHNYGHGGSGWTLGPGVVNYVNNLLLQSSAAAGIKKDTPITIIGAGVIGLFSAYDLYQRGYKKLIVIADKFDALTSHFAGGLISVSAMINHQHIQPIIVQSALDSYKFYQRIAQHAHADFQYGAKILPLYCDDDTHTGLEPFVGKVMQPAKKVLLDFGHGTTRKAVAFDDAILVYTVKMLQDLTNYLQTRQVEFVSNSVNEFAEIDTDIIVNCTGLGAARLNHDQDVIAVQGHLIRLKNQNPADLNYMLDVSFGEHQTESGQQVSRAFYFFPKIIPNSPTADIGVIGGTFIPGATEYTPNQEEFKIMVQNAKAYCGLD